MKKSLCFVLVLCLLVTCVLVGCNGKEDPSPSEPPVADVETSQTTTTTAPSASESSTSETSVSQTAEATATTERPTAVTTEGSTATVTKKPETTTQASSATTATKKTTTATKTKKPTVSTKKTTSSKKTTVTTTTTAPPGKSENNIEFIGRFATVGGTDHKQFEWSGSTITAGFEGTEIGITLKILRNGPYGDNDYFNVTVDNGKPYVLKITKGTDRYTLASGLKKGYHTVVVTKRTEGPFGALIQFEGFDYGSGKAAPAPARRERRIEIYGDSISAGYGNEGEGSGFRLEEENADLTYASITAKNLNAEYTAIALSGHGVHKSLSQSTTEVTPKYFDRNLYKTSGNYRFTQPDPDVVIINLGTNDYAIGVTDAEYYESYMDFIAKIRRKYRDAYIVVTTCGGTNRPLDVLQQIVDARKEKYGDEKIGRFIGVFEDVDGAFGADGHPSVYGHTQLADQLTEYLKEKLGW